MRHCEVCGHAAGRMGYVVLRPRDTLTAFLACNECYEWIAARQHAVNPPPQAPEKVAQANVYTSPY